ncbi:MAG: hypothetical protein JWO36_6458 [Myxococcales bacterium]|nr:hypothetical protein [Myxococcales bacterium]
MSISKLIARFTGDRQRFQPDTGRIGVRRLPLGMVVSVGIHVALVLWLATHRDHDVLLAPHPDEARPATVEILPPPGPDPVAITYLDERATRELEARATPQPSRTVMPQPARKHTDTGAREAVGPREAISTGAPRGPIAETPNHEPTGSGSSLMKMRGTDLTSGPPQPWVDDFLSHSKPLEKDVVASGELAPSGNGRYKSNQGSFEMTVDRDGAAHIKDAPNAHIGLRVPSPKAIGKGLSTWAEDPYGAGGRAGEDQKRGEYHALGDDDKPESSNVVAVPIVGGSFDATDWMMRRHGQDPYASKKLKVLDSTRDERVQIGKQRRAQQLAQSAELMRKNLDQLRFSTIDPRARKQELFELWDECAESGDTSLVDGGRAARSLVVGFIRSTIPKDSTDAYSDAELARLNAHRLSAARFAPYD